MVIVYLYDALNGYRYRKLGVDYYELVKRSDQIVGAWMIPNT